LIANIANKCNNVYFKTTDFQGNFREILRKMCKNHFLLYYHSTFPTTVILTALLKAACEDTSPASPFVVASFRAMTRCL